MRCFRFGFHRHHIIQRPQLHSVNGLFSGFRRLVTGSRAAGRSGNVAKDELSEPLILTFVPNAVDVADTSVDFALRVIGKQWIDNALVKAELAPV